MNESHNTKQPLEPMPQYWELIGLTRERFERDLTWLAEDRSLGQGLRYFELAADILRHFPESYRLLSAGFFHAVIGLERALRTHYKAPDKTYAEPNSETVFRDLIQQALDDGLISDELFAEIPMLAHPRGELYSTDKVRLRGSSKGYAKRLVEVIPDLRNQYFHGQMLRSPLYYDLTLHLRLIADQLRTRPRKNLLD